MKELISVHKSDGSFCVLFYKEKFGECTTEPPPLCTQLKCN